jgi:ribosome-associated protein
MRVIHKINTLIHEALEPVTPRRATRPSRAAKQNRLREKKYLSEKKQHRKKNWD